MTKAIQLTNRDPHAVWLDKKGNKIAMADLEDLELQNALVVCQTGKLNSFRLFMSHSKRETQLKQEAKNRNMEIKDMDYIKANYLGNGFCQFKDIMSALYSSIIKKLAKQSIKI